MLRYLKSSNTGEGHVHAFTLIACVSSLLALAAAAECHSAVVASHAAAPLFPSLMYGLVLWGWWGVVAYCLWIGLRRWPKASFLSWRLLLLHFVLGVAVSVAHSYLLQGTIAWCLRTWPGLYQAGYAELQYLNLGHFSLELLLYGFILGACLAVHLYLKTQEDNVRSIELEKQLSTAHLRALQMQIDPHFLFNTLNTVTALVEFDRKDEALETLGSLNTLLRTTLASNSPEKVPLGKELQMIESYLAIEQVRFADRLRVDVRIEPDALRGLVPCFLLQPLVENAIRHGIAHCESDGVVEASARREGRHLQLRIRDNGPGGNAPTKPGHGIGLRNTRDRLTHFYRDDYAMSANALAEGGFEVSIKIPYELAI
jgi:hypothetical protein